MPDRPGDITTGTLNLVNGSTTTFHVPEPAFHNRLVQMWAAPKTYGHVDSSGNGQLPQYPSATLLYLTITNASAEAREQFQSNEIKTDLYNWPFFADGWGRPIVWIRWAPGCSSNLPGGTAYYNTSTTALPAGTNLSGGFSDIQSGNYLTDHDPFDPRNLQADPSNLVNQAFRLIPLVLSAAGHTAINSLTAPLWMIMEFTPASAPRPL